MILHVPNVLTGEQVARCRQTIMQSKWVDGRVTAGFQSALVKNNLQLPEDSTEARELGDMILAALERHPLFISAALPCRVFPPIFNRYDVGMSLGTHVDNSIRPVMGTPFRVRTDLAATLFLSQLNEYDGGELVVDDVYGAHAVKLPAGEMVLYPATSLHHVMPVRRGTRLASIFWIQSMVRDDSHRRLLFELDMAINQVNQALPNHAAVVALTNCYHNLLRRDAEV
jgi:PKHD-type hydroxylase